MIRCVHVRGVWAAICCSQCCICGQVRLAVMRWVFQGLLLRSLSTSGSVAGVVARPLPLGELASLVGQLFTAIMADPGTTELSRAKLRF